MVSLSSIKHESQAWEMEYIMTKRKQKQSKAHVAAVQMAESYSPISSGWFTNLYMIADTMSGLTSDGDLSASQVRTDAFAEGLKLIEARYPNDKSFWNRSKELEHLGVTLCTELRDMVKEIEAAGAFGGSSNASLRAVVAGIAPAMARLMKKNEYTHPKAVAAAKELTAKRNNADGKPSKAAAKNTARQLEVLIGNLSYFTKCVKIGTTKAGRNVNYSLTDKQKADVKKAAELLAGVFKDAQAAKEAHEAK